MANLLFDPPYGSPIEEFFAWNFVKYANPNIDIRKQELISTTHGKFFLDFAVEDQQGYTIGIECDGKEFHDLYRDEWRDAIILGKGQISEIVRIRGADIHYNIEDVLFVLLIWFPNLFSESGRINLTFLASDYIKRDQGSKNDSLSAFTRLLFGDGSVQGSYVTRRNIPTGNKRQFWTRMAEFANKYPYKSVDELIEIHDEFIMFLQGSN